MSRETRGQALTWDGPPQQAPAWERCSTSLGWSWDECLLAPVTLSMAGLAPPGSGGPAPLLSSPVMGSKAWRRHAFYDKVLEKDAFERPT